MDELREQTIALVRGGGRESRAQSWIGFAISLALFVWLSGALVEPDLLPVLIGVLLFHELGHFVAMKAFGYTDVKIFFIPLFGAAVAGQASGIASWKRAVVAIAGPVPGILVAVVGIWLGAGAGRALVAQALGMMLVINLINLAPVLPLDGGKLLEVVAIGRGRGELLFLWVSGGGLLAIALLTKTVAAAVIGVAVLGSVRRRGGIIDATRGFAAEVPAPAPRIQDASDEELAVLYKHVEPLARTAWARALTMRNVHDRALARRPEPRQTAGLVATYVGAVVLGAWPVLSFVTASDALEHDEQFHDLTIRRPSSFKVTRNEAQLIMERGAEGVVVWSLPQPGQTAEQALGAAGVGLMMSVPPDPGTQAVKGHGPCAGRDGPTTSWNGSYKGLAVTIAACGVVHDGRPYVIATLGPRDGGKVAAEIAASAKLP